jgi:Putative prokaryotic signal transducing protein
VDEVVVATVDSEPIAELIAGRLSAEGIPARVRFESQSGIPRQIAPVGLGFGPGAFRVAVFASDASRAREVLADAEPQTYRQRPVLRAVATILMILVLLSFIPGVIQALAMLFGFNG